MLLQKTCSCFFRFFYRDLLLLCFGFLFYKHPVCYLCLFKSFEFGNRRRMSDKKPVILEFLISPEQKIEKTCTRIVLE